jgi:hypothetical protein
MLIVNSKVEMFPTYTDMFKFLSKNAFVIETIENGKMILKHNNETVEAEYGELNKENSLNPFNDQISSYRESLRNSMQSLMELGIEINKNEADKLKKMFSFLK